MGPLRTRSIRLVEGVEDLQLRRSRENSWLQDRYWTFYVRSRAVINGPDSSPSHTVGVVGEIELAIV